MAGLQLSGLASGFDWKSVVDQLIAVERVPQDKLRTQKTTNTNKLSAFSTLRTKLTALQDAVVALKADNLFGQRTTAFAGSDTSWTATASNGATAGEYAITVSQLATRSVRNGSSGRSSALNDTNDVSGLVVSEMRLATAVTDGVFSINGQQVEVASTDTLQDVFDKISTATGGDVTASYDAGTDQVTLTSAAPIELGSSADTSNFLYALKLYNNDGTSISSASALGTVGMLDSIASSGLGAAITNVDGDGNGSFVINGVTIGFNVNDDTLQSISNRVRDSAAGVTLSYDSGNDRFVLTNKNTGDLALNVQETAGGLLDALGLSGATTTRGVNAEFNVNGGATIVSASNVLSESVHGIKGLSVTADSTGTETVTVGADTASLEAGIRTFIAKYNDVQKFIDDQTKITVGADGKVTAALLADSRELTNIAQKLRSTIFSEVPGLTGDVRRLETMGIDFEGSSTQLQVRDSAKLSDALANNLADVSAMFTTATTGFSAQVDSYVTALTQSNGSLDTQEATFEKLNSSLDQQIADYDRRLDAERTRLEDSFIRMEQAQSLINSQLSALQSAISNSAFS